MTSASTSRRRAQFIAQGLTWKGTIRQSIWTPQLQNQLNQILTESPQLSFSAIAARLGLTRGQVIGRVDRIRPKEIIPTTLERLDTLNLQFTQLLQETELPRERKYRPKENQRFDFQNQTHSRRRREPSIHGGTPHFNGPNG